MTLAHTAGNQTTEGILNQVGTVTVSYKILGYLWFEFETETLGNLLVIYHNELTKYFYF